MSRRLALLDELATAADERAHGDRAATYRAQARARLLRDDQPLDITGLDAREALDLELLLGRCLGEPPLEPPRALASPSPPTPCARCSRFTADDLDELADAIAAGDQS